MVPSGKISIFSAFGIFESPGISIMSPAIATINPEPVLSSMSRIKIVKSFGAPTFDLSSVKLNCVLAIIIGKSA